MRARTEPREQRGREAAVHERGAGAGVGVVIRGNQDLAARRGTPVQVARQRRRGGAAATDVGAGGGARGGDVAAVAATVAAAAAAAARRGGGRGGGGCVRG